MYDLKCKTIDYLPCMIKQVENHGEWDYYAVRANVGCVMVRLISTK